MRGRSTGMSRSRSAKTPHRRRQGLRRAGTPRRQRDLTSGSDRPLVKRVADLVPVLAGLAAAAARAAQIPGLGLRSEPLSRKNTLGGARAACPAISEQRPESAIFKAGSCPSYRGSTDGTIFPSPGRRRPGPGDRGGISGQAITRRWSRGCWSCECWRGGCRITARQLHRASPCRERLRRRCPLPAAWKRTQPGG